MATVTTLKKPRVVNLDYREDKPLGMTWGDAITSFIISRRRGIEGAAKAARPRTLDIYREDLSFFTRFMEHRNITHYNDMTRADVLDFVDWVQKDSLEVRKGEFECRTKVWAKASRNKVFRALRTFFFWVEASEECRVENMRGFRGCLPAIPRNPQRPTIPNKDEIRGFLKSINTKTRAGMRTFCAGSLILDCGIRAGEVRFMLLNDVQLDVDRPFLMVPDEGKTGKRVVWLTSESVRLIKMWLRVRERFAPDDNPFLFITEEGKQMGPLCLYHSFWKQAKRAGVTNITPHALRHYFCTDWVRNGGDLAKLQAQTGHASLDTLKIYLHLANEQAVGVEAERVSPLKHLNR